MHQLPYAFKWLLIRGSFYFNLPSQLLQQTNKYTSLQKYKSLTLYFRKGDVLLCVRDEWRQGPTAILTQVLLLTIATLLLHLGLGCSTVGHWWSSPLQAGSPFGIPVSTHWRLQAPYLYSFLSPTCFRSSSVYLHRCIFWLTAQSRVNI